MQDNYQLLFSDQRSAISDQRSAISDQRSAISDQRSAISDQRSAISDQRSAISDQRSAISDQRSAISDRLKSKGFLPLFFLFFCSIYSLMSQPVNNLLKDVSMPAPNAASLGKYGDYTVGNFTGVPEIGIPIYTVQEGPLSLPVSLSYHASGIKAAEMASWVGAGWSLNAGGIISRTVQGLPDEKPLIGLASNTIIKTG